MIRLVVYVALVAAAVAGAVWFANDPGLVTIAWRGWRLDTSVGILLLLAAALVVAALALAKLYAVLAGSARAMTAARRDKKFAQGLAALGDGMAAVHAGHAEHARRLAKDAIALLGDNPATRMLAARAATGSDALNEAAARLLDRPGTALSGLRAQGEQALAAGDWTAAVNHARQALARKDAPRWAMELALDALIAGAQWREALALLEGKATRALLPADTHKALTARVALRLCDQLLKSSDGAGAETTARAAIAAGAGAAAVALEARALILQSKGKKAAAEIERAWAAAPDLRLLTAYKAIAPNEPALEWVKRVERLAGTAPEHPESRLAAAQAALAADLWGQARNRLAPLVADGVDGPVKARAARLMAEIETAERGDQAAAARWLRLALTHVGEDRTATARAPASIAELLAERL
ncbi:MAG: heme biosynthesis HemY N-terminal domain-containing protein [Rhodospirillaceae bacterium]|nr:heme biosynthesis HemY N-terminal domain-containing protein [Rhodospirillaceae bacterium]